MPYRVVVNGVPIECDSIEEALEMARRAGGAESDVPSRADQRERTNGTPGLSRWTDTRVADFFKIIEGNQRRLVDALLEHPEGRTDDQLGQMLGLRDGRQLGGVFAGLWKNAKKVGADPNDLYMKRRVLIGGRKTFEYFLSDSFRNTVARTKVK